MTQLTLFSGEQLRDMSIRQAVMHANAVWGDWKLQAYRFLIFYLNDKPACFTFMCEDVIIASVDYVPLPPTNKAWGDTMVKGRKAGLMKFYDYGHSKIPQHHKGTKAIWVKN